MRMTIAIMYFFTSFLPHARAEDTQRDIKPERVVLHNGATVLLAPYPEAKVVAVEIFHQTGFCDEPAGMIQASHLLEHLLCQGATSSYGPGESFALLRNLGMANAETLPTLSHFDFTAPADDLETILKIEGERLTSLKITSDLISMEADKCDEETQYVYRAPQSGMVKHAFMALFQFWNHGIREVRVRGGLDQIPQENLEAFYRDHYRADKLTVAIAGGFDKKEALKLAEKHLGSIPAQKAKERLTDWSSLPPKGNLTWDVDLHAICLYVPPPADPAARRLLSLWGTAFMQKLAANNELRELAHMTFASNTTWPVGDLPFFVYAAAKSANHLAKIEQIMKDLLRDAPKQLAGDLVQIGMFDGSHRGAPVPPWDQVKSQAAAFAKTASRSEEDTIPLILLNAALQWGIREISGVDFAAGDVTDEHLREVLVKTLDPTAFHIVILGPPPSVEVGP